MKFPPLAGFPSLSGEVATSAPPSGKPPPSAAVKEIINKKNKKTRGTAGAPVSLRRLGRRKENNLGRLRRPKFRAPPVLLPWGDCDAPNGFKNVTRSMMIPNMCLVIKLVNGKVVSIANRQTNRITESPNHPVPYYYIDSMRVHVIWTIPICDWIPTL